MKRILLLIMPLLALGCQAQEKKMFDINRYKDTILERACPRYAKSAEDVRLKDYALVDIDGDGKPELWVRGDEGQDWQGVFSLDGDSLTLLADADVCIELEFYKNAVGYSGYISPGRVYEGVSVLKNSRVVSSADKQLEFNIFSDEQETLFESYDVNGKDVDEDTYNEFVQKLGDTVEVKAEWIAIE